MTDTFENVLARQQLNICPASRAHMCQTLCLKNSILPCALRTCLHTIHVHIYSDLLLLTGNSSTCVITHKERQNTKYRPCALGIDIIHVQICTKFNTHKQEDAKYRQWKYKIQSLLDKLYRGEIQQMKLYEIQNEKNTKIVTFDKSSLNKETWKSDLERTFLKL